MIEFLKRIRDIAGMESEIGEYGPDSTFLYPFLLLTPISEKWNTGLLGNVMDKTIRIRLSLFLENDGKYEDIAQEAVNTLKGLLLDKRIKDEIITFISADVQLSLIEEQTVMCATLDTSLEITRR